MAISNLSGTGEINKSNKIYSTEYLMNYSYGGMLLIINFVSSAKVETINELKNYIKTNGKRVVQGTWSINISGIYITPDNTKYYPYSLRYYDETNPGVYNDTLHFYSYSESKQHSQTKLTESIPEGQSGTISLVSTEV